LLQIEIPASVGIVNENWFSKCNSLSEAMFTSESRLSRIEKQKFAEIGLIDIEITASVEILGECCFLGCVSLTSLTFEQGSRLSGIEK
jgi:hypothetical protein